MTLITMLFGATGGGSPASATAPSRVSPGSSAPYVSRVAWPVERNPADRKMMDR
jgi:hypothetical protein